MSIKRIRDEGKLSGEPVKKQCIDVGIDELTCPITREIFNIPVIADDGFTYEKWAIDKWLLEGDGEAKSPMNREDISSYYENKMVKSMVTKLLESNEELKEDQFDSGVYVDFLQNTEYFIQALNNKNFNKFQNATNIRLNHFAQFKIRHNADLMMNRSESVIKYLCRFPHMGANTFEQIFKNSFDLNCPNCKSNKPMYYILKKCSLPTIECAIRIGADLTGLSNSTNVTFLILIFKNKQLTEEDRNIFIEYLFDNDKIVSVFNDHPQSIMELDNVDLIKRILNVVIEDEESLYKFADLSILDEMIFEQKYEKILKLFEILETCDFSFGLLCDMYERKYIDQHISYLNNTLTTIYGTIFDNSELDYNNKPTIMKKLREFCDKLRIDDIDDKLLELNMIVEQKNLDSYKKTNDQTYNTFVHD